jgi:predicted nucleic acid-binding Zn ribbon protein
MTSTAPTAATPAPAPAPEQTHGCVRCGARIPLNEAMCESCNPLGLKSPAASQAHATVVAGIGIAVVVMAVVARLMIADVGPFTSSVERVVTDPAGLKVTVSVTNAGRSDGSTTCRIDDPSIGGIGPDATFVESPRVPGGGTMTFDVVVAGYGTAPRELTADCER